MIQEALLASAVGGLMWLDRYQVGQLMISRPMVACVIIGWALGDLAVGLSCGLLYELFGLRQLPAGGVIPPDVTLASVATCGVAVWVKGSAGGGVNSVVVLCFLCLLPVSLVGKRLDEHLRTGLARIARGAEVALVDGGDRKVLIHFLAAVGLGFSLAFVVLFPVIVGFSFLLGHLFPMLPVPLKRALGLGYYMIALIGVADLFLDRPEQRLIVLFAVGFCVTVVGGFCLGR